MEVVHESNSIPKSPFVPPDKITLNPDMQYLEKLRQEQERQRMETLQPRPQEIPAQHLNPDETITKRNAAMIVLSYTGQKKQMIIFALLGGVGIFLIGTIAQLAAGSAAGILAGLFSVIVMAIYFGSLFLSNEKEIKELKTRWVI